MKKMKKFLLTALAALVTFSSCGGALADAELPYTTYNYDYWGDIVYTPAAYVPAGSITGASFQYNGQSLGAFKNPQDLCVAQDGTVYLLCDRGNIVDTVSAAKWSQYIQIEGLTLLNPQVGSEARASATQQAVLDQLLSMLVLLDDKGMLHEVQVIDLSDAARITMQYMGRFQVEFLWDADFNYKLDYLAAVVEKLEANEKGTIDMTQDGKASFIPS